MDRTIVTALTDLAADAATLLTTFDTCQAELAAAEQARDLARKEAEDLIAEAEQVSEQCLAETASSMAATGIQIRDAQTQLTELEASVELLKGAKVVADSQLADVLDRLGASRTQLADVEAKLAALTSPPVEAPTTTAPEPQPVDEDGSAITPPPPNDPALAGTGLSDPVVRPGGVTISLPEGEKVIAPATVAFPIPDVTPEPQAPDSQAPVEVTVTVSDAVSDAAPSSTEPDPAPASEVAGGL